MEDRSARTWVWASLLLQALGYGFDAIWHGLLNPGVEPTTRSEMVRHLGTVHLPLYIGAASVLVSTSRALLRQIRRSATGIALPITVAGAMLSTAAEAWHAYSHLRLDTHSAPIAGVLSVIGFFVIVIAMALSRGAGDAPPIRPTHGTPYNRSVRPRMLGRVRHTIC
jgi:predicted membrane protein